MVVSPKHKMLYHSLNLRLVPINCGITHINLLVITGMLSKNLQRWLFVVLVLLELATSVKASDWLTLLEGNRSHGGHSLPITYNKNPIKKRKGPLPSGHGEQWTLLHMRKLMS